MALAEERLVQKEDVQGFFNQLLNDNLPDNEVLKEAIYDYLAGSVGFKDLVADEIRERAYNVFNVKFYGGIGDGQVHLLSERYDNLAAAQEVYPSVTSAGQLGTETIDWHAHRKAITAALSAGYGKIYSPGHYIMRGPSGGLKFPEMTGRYRNANLNRPIGHAQVDWYGDAIAGTVMQWDEDKGSARPGGTSSAGVEYAIAFAEPDTVPTLQSAGTRYANNYSSTGFLQDMNIVGPETNETLGLKGKFLNGILWASQRRLRNIRVTGFYAGIDIVGDHTILEDVETMNCYYGIFINHNSVSKYGDLTMIRGGCENSRMANVGFAFGGQMGTWTFVGRVFLGQAPYALFKEATPLTVTGALNAPAGFVERQNFLAGVNFGSTFFEGLGNGVVHDENHYVNGACRAILDECHFDGMTLPGWSDAKKIAGRDRQHIKVRSLYGCSFHNITKMEAVGCTGPLIEITEAIYGQPEISGHIEGILASCATAGVPFFSCRNPQYLNNVRVKNIKGDGSCGGYEGTLYPVRSGQTVAANDVVGISGATVFNYAGKMGEGDVDRLFAGIARSGAAPVGSFVNSAVVASGGTDYAVGDRITPTGGVGTQPVLQVTGISGGGAKGPATTVAIYNQGAYTTTPANPVAQGTTTGTGSGATFTLGTTAGHGCIVVAQKGEDIPVAMSGVYGFNELRSVGPSGTLRKGWNRLDGLVIGRAGASSAKVTLGLEQVSTDASPRIVAKSANFTVTGADIGTTFEVNGASDVIVTISDAFPARGWFGLVRLGATNVTVVKQTAGTAPLVYPTGANRLAGAGAQAAYYCLSNAGTDPIIRGTGGLVL